MGVISRRKARFCRGRGCLVRVAAAVTVLLLVLHSWSDALFLRFFFWEPPTCCCVAGTSVNSSDGVCWPPPAAAGGRRYRILFWSNELGPHGTEAAVYDYAHYFEEEMCGEAFIGAYEDGARGSYLPHAMGGRAKFEARFPDRVSVLPNGGSALDTLLESVGADVLYTIQAGCDEIYIDPSFRPIIVHAVFHANARWERHYEPTNDTRCAAIAPFEKITPGVPVVPHMTSADPLQADALPLPLPTGTQRVFCRHGGPLSMNIGYVRSVMQEHARNHPHDVFLLWNTAPVPGDDALPNLVFHPMSTDPAFKRRFLATCSACLHAREEGESFGLAIAECANAGLPVITSAAYRYEGFHLKVLGEHAIRYDSVNSLVELLRDFDPAAHRTRADVYRGLYARFSPQLVMRQFVENFGILDGIVRAANPRGLGWRGRCTPPPHMARWLREAA